ncbi:Glycine betaine/carnitine/choline transport system permease protein OpuCD [Corynebacterium ciconiae DSM 44920]|uniref:ABC transporter permease n=1 Tax=Corynebacterium ciconiae TaxID=227319 RepID=UPI00037BDABB|nr:ABC transporter permease [Corynebacterium ciconiae]WKD62134.1 Glycine betaine/carnitine/choline transport system permease protein OpuCD [Corynebacterium ciconiae DSM 44920]
MNISWIAENIGYIADLAFQHALLAVPAIVASFVLALPFGFWQRSFPAAREVLIGAVGLLYAVPSLALFIVMPLLLGTSVLSPVNVVVAMILYGLALQIRSTTDAFASVPRAPIEAAEAMGYSRWQRLLQVEFPLALPVLVAGLRVVSASTISLISVGALIGVQSLGTLFTHGFQRAFPTEILTGVLATVVLAVIFDLIIVLIGRVSTPWVRAAQQGGVG